MFSLAVLHYHNGSITTMREYYLTYLLTAMCFLLVYCSSGTEKLEPHSQPDITQLEEQVKATLIDMWDAIEKGDIERYASSIHPNFTQFGEADPTLNIGKEVEVNAITEWMKTSSDVHTEMEEPIVTVKDDVAWIVYYWKDHGFSNGTSFSSKGKSTRIFVRENERWLCIHGHYTLLP